MSDEVDLIYPIRPTHAGNGWEFKETPRGPRLVKDYGGPTGLVRATTPRTCSWTVRRSDGSFWREASSTSAEAAKAAADEWIAVNLREEP
ncbi:hypothetical protein [Nocardia wallacei]|uniref:hypothetical protein n=1 Tax=Nocardia wallacei TaxID=480035 RepID=UPI002453A50A|nr:hypothetical protein [Nocardia wallacei]